MKPGDLENGPPMSMKLEVEDLSSVFQKQKSDS